MHVHVGQPPGRLATVAFHLSAETSEYCLAQVKGVDGGQTRSLPIAQDVPTTFGS